MNGKIKDYLEKSNVAFDSIIHPVAFSAQNTAATAHIKGKDFAKTVIIKLDGNLAMAVVPASKKIDFEELKQVLPVKKIELATELEFRSKFPDCEIGAMPPLGNLYGMEVFVSDELLENSEIAFNAGTHTEVLKMSMEEFKKIVEPKIMHFTKNYSF